MVFAAAPEPLERVQTRAYRAVRRVAAGQGRQHGVTAADVTAAIARQDAGRVYGTLDEHPAIEE